MRRLARLGLLFAVLLGGPFLAALIWVTLAPPPLPGMIAGPVGRIVVEKAARRMTLWQGGAEVREYRIALGFAPEGDKQRQGDGRTPEGTFRIDRSNRGSAYHLSLGLDYPQAADRARAAMIRVATS